MVTEFTDHSSEPAVRGFLHTPEQAQGDTLILTHGAGANCQSALLTAVASRFAEAGFLVLRCDLPFRQSRPKGPPFPAVAARDRQGLRRAVALMRPKTAGHIFLGGHSYGGRQATMLVAEEPALVDGLLLLSYPLHPPRKPQELRVAHFPKLSAPVMFVHGSRDPFASFAEMNAALEALPGRKLLLPVENAGHELLSKKLTDSLPGQILETFQTFFR